MLISIDRRMKSKNGKYVSTPAEIFERHVKRSSGCWEWQGFRNESGYGFTRIGGRGAKGLLAHRLSWSIHHGEIPAGLAVLHRCDNPSCVRPDHLFLGTDADNCADKVMKGRQFRKWSAEQIVQMRAARRAGEKVIDISRRFGIQRDYLSRILNNHDRSESC